VAEGFCDSDVPQPCLSQDHVDIVMMDECSNRSHRRQPSCSQKCANLGKTSTAAQLSHAGVVSRLPV